MAAVLTDRRRTAPEVAPIHPAAQRPLALYRPGHPGATTARGAVPTSWPADAARSRRCCPADRPAPEVYRRRRLLAGGLLLLAIAAVLVVAQLIQAGIGGGPLTATGAAAAPGMIPSGATEYVVRPGDTLWSIAGALRPGGDERPLVDQLAREVHGTSLYPGEVIPVPTGR